MSPTVLADALAAPLAISAPMQLTLYCVAVGLASLAGGAFAASFKLGHRRLQIALSFVAGTMLAVGLLHLLPHAVILALEESASKSGGLSHGALHGALDGVALSAVLGFVAMFLLERFFHFHQHETPEEAGHHDCCDDGCDAHAVPTDAERVTRKSQGERHTHSHAKSHAHSHGLSHGHSHGGSRTKSHSVTQLGWI
ncbi:MAG: ZIP family metal transporter, partial [Limnohabitans sp.]|nr:ZIP family metal transporter [Limnohabitans sp.]